MCETFSMSNGNGLNRFSKIGRVALFAAGMGLVTAGVYAQNQPPQKPALHLAMMKRLHAPQEAEIQAITPDVQKAISQAMAEVAKEMKNVNVEIEQAMREVDVAQKAGVAMGNGQKIHVDVPAVHVKVPAIHIHIPKMHVKKDGKVIDVPEIKIDIPMIKVDVPAIKVDVPEIKIDEKKLKGGSNSVEED